MSDSGGRLRLSIIAGSVLFLALLVGIVATVGKKRTPERARGIASEEMQKRLLDDPVDGPLYRAIERTYPDEFQTLVAQLSKLEARGAPRTDIDAATHAFDAEASERHLGELLRSPHADLAKIWNARLRLLEALAARSPRECTAWVSDGEIRGGRANVKAMALANAISVAGWEAAAAGRDRGVNRPKALGIKARTDAEIRELEASGAFGRTPEAECQWYIESAREFNHMPADEADRTFLSILADGTEESGT